MYMRLELGGSADGSGIERIVISKGGGECTY